MSKYCFMGVSEEKGSMVPKFNLKEIKEDGLDGMMISFGNWSAIPVFGGGYSAITSYLGELILDNDIELYISNREILPEIEEFIRNNEKFIGNYFIKNRINVDYETFIVKGIDNIRIMNEDKNKEIGVILETIFVF